MSGFSESLSLDVAEALRQIDRLAAQMQQAAQQFRVEALRAIDDLRATRLELSLDTSGMASQVSSALGAADTTVDVDTSRIRPEIEAAVPNEIDVPVDADTSRARSEIRRLDDDLDSATGRAGLLRNALAAVGTAAVIQGIRGIADAGGALQEQLSGSTVVFGEFAGQVQAFAQTAPSIGLASDEALRASNNFGLMAQSAGLARAAAADFATTIVARAADIASLRDLDLGETIQALQSGLAGETEPLRRLGSFLSEARVQAEAFRLGLAGAGEELTEQAKIQARYSLILADTAIAQGDFARTADSLTNTQRQLRAEFRDMVAAIGIDLEPAFSNLVGEGRDLLPVFDELVRSVLPPLLETASALAPAFGTFGEILIALSPALELLADVVGAVPPSVLAAVGAFASFNSVAGSAVTGLRNIGVAVPATQGAFAALSGTLVLASVGLAAYAETQRRAAEFEADRERTITTLNQALDEGAGLTEALAAALEKANAEDEDFRSALSSIGASTSEFASAATSVDGFTAALSASVGARRESVDLSYEEVLALANQATALREGVSARLEYLGNLSDSNQALVTSALVSTRAADGTNDEAAALALVNRELARQAREHEEIVATYGPLITATTGAADALALLGGESEPVRDLLRGLRSGTQVGAGGFLNLALAIGEANLSTEAFAAAAALAGVDVEDLTGLVEMATSELDRFVSAAVGGLPTVASVFDGVLAQAQADAREFADTIREIDPAGAAAIEESARVTADGLRQGLQAAAFELGDFRNDLASLTAAGFAPLAGMLAEQGAEAGNALADELAQALADGNLELLTGLQEAQGLFEDQSLETVEFLRTTLGPQLLSESALITAALTRIVEGADPTEALEVAGRLAQLELDDQGRQIATLAALAGEDAARSYAEALDFEGPTVDAAIAAGLALTSSAPVDEAHAAGVATGDGFAAGLLSRADYVAWAASVLASVVPGRIEDQLAISSPSKVMERLGAFTAEGFALGISDGSALVARSSEALAQAAMVNTSRMTLGGAPGGPAGGFDDSRMIAAMERLAAKVGDTNTWQINGATDPFRTGQEIQRQQRARRRGR